MSLRALIFVLFLFALSAGRSLVYAQELDATQQARYQQMTQELRCLVCQNQTIADSDAPLAADLRGQVRQQILQGHSDADIKQYLTDRYGDFVLYKPPFKASTVLLWLAPALLVVLALLTVFLFTRRSQRRAAAAPPDAAALKKLLE